MEAGPTLAQYGLAGLVILVLAGVVAYLYRELKASTREKDSLFEQRLADARETRDKLSVQSEKQIDLSEKIYDLLIDGKRRK